MRNIFDIDSKLMRFVVKTFDGMCISILWFLLCIPLVTAGAATTALYTTVYRYFRNDEGGCIRVFWKAFREDWKRSTLIGLLFLAVVLLLGVDVLVFRTMALQGNLLGKLYWFILFLCGLVLTWSVYLYAYCARFNGSVWEVVKTSFILMIVHPIQALKVFAPAVLGTLMCVMAPSFLTIVPMTVYYACSFTTERVFAMHLQSPIVPEEPCSD